MSNITITVSGPVGCGKSAIAGKIQEVLRREGLFVQCFDEEVMEAELVDNPLKWDSNIQMYKPKITIISVQI